MLWSRGGRIAMPNGDLLPALEIPALKVIDNLDELVPFFLFDFLEFEGVAEKATVMVVFNPFDFGLLHVNGIARHIMIAWKYHADIIDLLVHFQYRPPHELEIVFGKNPVNTAKADIDQVYDTPDFFQIEMHLGSGQGVYPEISATLQPLHVLGKGDFQTLLAKLATPGVEDVLQMIRSVEVEPQVP